MAMNDSELESYLASLGLEEVDITRSRGEPPPEPYLDVPALQAKLRSRDRGTRSQRPPAPPAATTENLSLLRVRSTKDPDAHFTVILSRDRGVIVGEQD